jgi:hypothetical protein
VQPHHMMDSLVWFACCGPRGCNDGCQPVTWSASCQSVTWCPVCGVGWTGRTSLAACLPTPMTPCQYTLATHVAVVAVDDSAMGALPLPYSLGCFSSHIHKVSCQRVDRCTATHCGCMPPCTTCTPCSAWSMQVGIVGTLLHPGCLGGAACKPSSSSPSSSSSSSSSCPGQQSQHAICHGPHTTCCCCCCCCLCYYTNNALLSTGLMLYAHSLWTPTCSASPAHSLMPFHKALYCCCLTGFHCCC